jgi:SAM-dependent methyltransferase
LVREAPPRIFDRKAIALHRARAATQHNYLGLDFQEDLAGRLGVFARDFEAVLDLDGFCNIGPPLATPRIHRDLDADEVFAAEPAEFDLVLSHLGLHAVNDLPGVLIQIRRALKPDGLLLASMFAGETLTELRQSFAAAESEVTGGISPRVYPFADVRDLGGLLQRAGFALPVADVERTVVRYRDLSQLFADLRAMGETNALVERSRKSMHRDLLRAAAAHYAENFADPDGRLRATFDIVYLTGWSPHESQQQPLKPGSATARLADALGTTERPAGEKPQR